MHNWWLIKGGLSREPSFLDQYTQMKWPAHTYTHTDIVHYGFAILVWIHSQTLEQAAVDRGSSSGGGGGGSHRFFFACLYVCMHYAGEQRCGGLNYTHTNTYIYMYTQNNALVRLTAARCCWID